MNKYIPFIIFIVIVVAGFLVVRADYYNQNQGIITPVDISNDGDEDQLNGNQDGVTDGKPKATTEFVQCLADAGVIIYGSKTCPACFQLEQSFGGYEIVKPIYIDCSGLTSPSERDRCAQEMQTNYIPEIQIKGKLFESGRSLEILAQATGCQL